jgi:hypothetical protein
VSLAIAYGLLRDKSRTAEKNRKVKRACFLEIFLKKNVVYPFKIIGTSVVLIFRIVKQKA